MKKITKALIALVAVAAGALIPASSSMAGSSSCVRVPDPYSGPRYQMQKYFSVTFSRNGDVGTATVKRLSSKPLCEDQPMVLQSFKMASTWNGGPDGRDSFLTSLPQTKAYATPFTFGKNDKTKTVSVDIPECEGTQLDVYVGSKEVAGVINQHDGEVREIRGEIFQARKCEPQKAQEIKEVKVCNPKTGKIITVPETEADDYEPVDSEACRPKPVVREVEVCDPKTNKIITVKEMEKDQYESKYSDKCKLIEVCIKDSGDITMQTITRDKFDSKIHSHRIADCRKPEVVTPPKPTVELPKTGVETVLSGLIGSGALTYGVHGYIVSRRTPKK